MLYEKNSLKKLNGEDKLDSGNAISFFFDIYFVSVVVEKVQNKIANSKQYLSFIK